MGKNCRDSGVQGHIENVRENRDQLFSISQPKLGIEDVEHIREGGCGITDRQA